MDTVELHGRKLCPYAWRTRLVALEKGIVFEWYPFDVPEPSPRAALHNPDDRSPLLVHGDFKLIESLVIEQYLDEAFPGRALQPADPRARALMRLTMTRLGSRLEPHAYPGHPVDGSMRHKVEAAHQLLDEQLADGREWLEGRVVTLVDLQIWPFLAAHAHDGMGIAPHHERASAYFARMQAHTSYIRSHP